ncbi:MAG TPA: branched-chain amino acid ABC transporter substrate-binding protein [Terriglobia bacterium]|nr:branched-chain amino acid ABC transporter substrate-binding protein [Terriglobia bacterium]
MNTIRKIILSAAMLACAPAVLAQNVKIAYIEPLSGGMANVGELGAKNLGFIIDEINAKGGVLGGRKFELVTFDNKLSPQESLVALKSAIDQNIQYITQGNGSSVAAALIDGVNKNNDRNPDKRVVFLNHSAVDPDFTNSKCSFWHFRFDANSDMKMAAITDAIKKDTKVKKVFLVNQDYSHGHQVTKAAKAMLKQKRPDVQIVGEDLHPLAKVKDFAPYVAKIKSAGADTVITGNWGADLTLLIKAAKDSGLDAQWYTYYAGGFGFAPAVGDAGVGKVKAVVEWHANVPNPKAEAFYASYKKKYPDAKDEFFYYRMKNMMELLAKAMEQAKSTDPLKVAQALEGMKYQADMGEVEMRKDDHQLIQPLFIGTMAKAGTPGVKHDLEGSGYGFSNDIQVPPKDTALPTTCKMKRPSK